MVKPEPDPSRNPSRPGLARRLLRGLGGFAKEFALHILGYFVIGLLIGIAIWLFGGFDLPEALAFGLLIVGAMILIGGAGS